MWMTKCSNSSNNFDQLYFNAAPASSAPIYSDFEPIERPSRKRSFEVDICPFRRYDDHHDPLSYQEPLESNHSHSKMADSSCSKFRISRVRRSSEASEFSSNLSDYKSITRSHDNLQFMSVPLPTSPISRFSIDVIPFVCEPSPVAVDDLIQF